MFLQQSSILFQERKIYSWEKGKVRMGDFVHSSTLYWGAVQQLPSQSSGYVANQSHISSRGKFNCKNCYFALIGWLMIDLGKVYSIMAVTCVAERKTTCRKFQFSPSTTWVPKTEFKRSETVRRNSSSSPSLFPADATLMRVKVFLLSSARLSTFKETEGLWMWLL